MHRPILIVRTPQFAIKPGHGFKKTFGDIPYSVKPKSKAVSQGSQKSFNAAIVASSRYRPWASETLNHLATWNLEAPWEFFHRAIDFTQYAASWTHGLLLSNTEFVRWYTYESESPSSSAACSLHSLSESHPVITRALAGIIDRQHRDTGS